MHAAPLRSLCLAAAVAGLLLGAREGPAATPAHWPKGITIGGTNLGAAAYAYQAAWAMVLTDKLGLNAQVEATGGPQANIQLIQSKQTDFGSTSMGPAYEGYHGLGWAKGKRYDQIRILFPMYASYWQWWALAKSPIRHIRDVQGYDIALSGAGSTPDYYGRKMLEFFGVKPKRIINGGFGDSNNMMRDGILPASAAFAGIPHPAAVELSTTHDIRMLGLPKADAERFVANFPELGLGEIPAGTYKGQDRPIETISVWFAMLTHKDVPEDLAYAVVKATFEGRDALIRGLKSAQETVPENVGNVTAVPLHVGAVRFFKERGIAVPAKALPPEHRP